MQRGRPIPQDAMALVLQLARRKRRLTNRRIREEIHDRFGLDLSERTICRHCQQAGLPTSSLRPRPPEQGLPAAGPAELYRVLRRLEEEARGAWGSLGAALIEVETGRFKPDRITDLLSELGVEPPSPDARSDPYEMALKRHAPVAGEPIRLRLAVEDDPLFPLVCERLEPEKVGEAYETWGRAGLRFAEFLLQWYQSICVLSLEMVGTELLRAAGAVPSGTVGQARIAAWRCTSRVMACDFLAGGLAEGEPTGRRAHEVLRLWQLRREALYRLEGLDPSLARTLKTPVAQTLGDKVAQVEILLRTADLLGAYDQMRLGHNALREKLTKLLQAQVPRGLLVAG